MLLFKRGIRKISSRIVIPGINTNISHNSSAKITSGKMAANNGKPRARALSLNFPLFRPDDRPHNRPVLGLDTNFRIFFEIFGRFREIFKISGNLKKMWIFRAIVTKRYVTRAEKRFFYNLLLSSLHNLQFCGNFQGLCSVYEPAILHIQQI